MKIIYNNLIKYIFLVLISFTASQADSISELTGIYTGEYQMTVRAHPAGSTLGQGVKEAAWTWDFDKYEVIIKGTTLSVGFNYALHDIDNIRRDDILNFEDNNNGTYTVFYQFQIYHPGLGNPRKNTNTTFKITETNGVLNINTIDAEIGEVDGILGTQIIGVFPLTIEPSLQGTARLLGYDQNNDGISDEDAIKLGLDPSKLDNDKDGISDVDEIGDINNPIDSDGDGVIDALEAGDSAYSSNTVNDIQLLTGDSISIVANKGIYLSNVRVDSMKIEIPNNTGLKDLIKKDSTLGAPGLNYALGNLNFTTTLNGDKEIVIKLTLSSNLPKNLLLYLKEFKTQDYVLLSNEKWKRLDSNTLEITLSDKNEYDLDGLENQEIIISLALAENTIGQVKRKDESAGSIYLSLIFLFLTLLGKNLFHYNKE